MKKEEKDLSLDALDNKDLLTKAKEIVRRRAALSGAPELQPISDLENIDEFGSVKGDESLAAKEARLKNEENEKIKKAPLPEFFGSQEDEEKVALTPDLKKQHDSIMNALDATPEKELTLEDYNKEMKSIDPKDPVAWLKLRKKYRYLIK